MFISDWILFTNLNVARTVTSRVDIRVVAVVSRHSLILLSRREPRHVTRWDQGKLSCRDLQQASCRDLQQANVVICSRCNVGICIRRHVGV